MRRSQLLLAAAAIGAVVLVVAISSLAPKPADTGLLKPDDVQVTALGRQVYATHCAACHGAKLEGQPDWRQRDAQGRLPAPPSSGFDVTRPATDSELPSPSARPSLMLVSPLQNSPLNMSGVSLSRAPRP